MTKFKRKTIIRPAYDKRHSDPHKNYGIHGADLCFYLIGEKGAIQFIIYTGWHLPHVKAEFIGRNDLHDYYPMAADIGYHSPHPMYPEQSKMHGSCHLLKGDCYYDGSSLNAEKYLQILIAEGTKGLWKAMKKYYNETFED